MKPPLELVELHPGVFFALVDGKPYEVRFSPGEIAINGHQIAYEREDPREWKGAGRSAGRKGSASLKAPMPGKIVKLLVEVGSNVEAGQGVLVIEAMKMQNELKAPKAGRVTSVAVQPGDSVTAGMVLAVIE